MITISDDVNSYDILLTTFPDSDENYCKIFTVPKVWLLDLLETLDSLNERKGVNLENFLENYLWDETFFIYEQAQKEEKILYEEEKK